jgi:hypothetical protein
VPSGWEVEQIALAGAANGRQRDDTPDRRCMAKGKIMRSVLGQLVIWMGEMLDRSLITVPEVDEDFPPFAADRHGTCQDHGFADAEADVVCVAGRRSRATRLLKRLRSTDHDAPWAPSPG